jgi:hypothetical protein
MLDLNIVGVCLGVNNAAFVTFGQPMYEAFQKPVKESHFDPVFMFLLAATPSWRLARLRA